MGRSNIVVDGGMPWSQKGWEPVLHASSEIPKCALHITLVQQLWKQ